MDAGTRQRVAERALAVAVLAGRGVAERDVRVQRRVLEAGRRRLAIGRYLAQNGKWQPDGELQNLTIEEFVDQISEPILVCGELSGEARERLSQTKSILPPPAQCVRRPAVLAEMAWKRWKAGEVDDPATLKPIYLHHGDPIPE